jgi:asparagine synthase (glutamine-hydrolysing)
MSGICGIHNLFLNPLNSPDLIDRMSEQLKHRGPDNHGKIERPHLAIAVRQLSVPGPNAGNQPFSNENGEITLVADGQIYNHRDLRKALQGRGHQMKTQSAGEVIVHLYEEKGIDFVRELDGMFAIALWDDRTSRLVLARDRAGEKPLYYWMNEETVLFGSEIKSLLQSPLISRRLDPDAVAQYFFYGYVPTPLSIFADIRKLPAAHRMIVEGRTARIECYWKLQDSMRTQTRVSTEQKQEEEVCAQLRTRFREATASRIVSDAPMGVFLNADIKSSVACAAASELLPGKIKCFSVLWPGEPSEEIEFTASVAGILNVQHHVVRADYRSLRDALLTLADHLDEPLADPAIIQTYLLSHFAREHVDVALTSEGGDELFGSHPAYTAARMSEYYLKIPKVVRRPVWDQIQRLLSLSVIDGPKGITLSRFLNYAEDEPAVRHYAWFGMISPDELDRLFAPEWLTQHPPIRSIFNPLSRVLEGTRFDDALAELLYLDFRMLLEDGHLTKADRASMACSLETRAPFLDCRLVEYAASLPTHLKLRGLKREYILKKVAEMWLPRKMIYSRKQAFPAPNAGWIRDELKPLVAETLDHGKLNRQGIFNSTVIHQMLQEHWDGQADHRKALWTLFSFQLWYDRWIAKNQNGSNQ